MKALVLIPELYEDGVEAARYKYANGDFIEAEKNAIESKDDHNVACLLYTSKQTIVVPAQKFAYQGTFWKNGKGEGVFLSLIHIWLSIHVECYFGTKGGQYIQEGTPYGFSFWT